MVYVDLDVSCVVLVLIRFEGEGEGGLTGENRAPSALAPLIVGFD